MNNPKILVINACLDLSILGRTIKQSINSEAFRVYIRKQIGQVRKIVLYVLSEIIGCLKFGSGFVNLLFAAMMIQVGIRKSQKFKCEGQCILLF